MLLSGKIQLAACVFIATVAGIHAVADGIVVPFTGAPYHMNLRVNTTHVCGATVISATWLVTAAQCVRGVEADWVTIHAGESTASALRSAAELVPHPDFEPYTLDNDVALVRIATPYNFTAEPVRAIQIVEANFEFPPGTLANITGYGPASAWPSMRGANVTLISQDECMAQYYRTGLTESMMCGRLEGASLRAGDAGGPLVAHGRAAAVSSHRLRRGAGVFTRLALPRVRSFLLQHAAV